jgi:hypothetical protein
MLDREARTNVTVHGQPEVCIIRPNDRVDARGEIGQEEPETEHRHPEVPGLADEAIEEEDQQKERAGDACDGKEGVRRVRGHRYQALAGPSLCYNMYAGRAFS